MLFTVEHLGMASEEKDTVDGRLKYFVFFVIVWIAVFPIGVMTFLETEFLKDVFASLRYDELFIKSILEYFGIHISSRAGNYMVGVAAAYGAFAALLNTAPTCCVCLIGGIIFTEYLEKIR